MAAHMDRDTANIIAAGIAIQAQNYGKYETASGVMMSAPALALEGSIGIGKSSIIEAMLDYWEYYYELIQVSQQEPEAASGFPKVVAMTIGKVKEFVTALIPAEWVGNLKQAMSNSKYKGVALIADEMSEAPRRTQLAYQGPLLNRMFGRIRLVGLATIAIFNPPAISTTNGSFSVAVANRFCMLFDFKVSFKEWRRGMLEGFGPPPVVKLPKDWQKSIRIAMEYIMLYLEQNPRMVQATEEEILEREEAWKPIYTRRSWTHGAILWAAAQAAGCDQQVQHLLLAGCVGEKASQDFFHWKERLKLGDASEYLTDDWLKNGEFKNNQGDVVSATVAMVSMYYMRNKTPKTFMRMLRFIEKCADLKWEGIAVSYINSLDLFSPSSLPKGISPKDWKEVVCPIMSKFPDFIQQSGIAEHLEGHN